MEHAKGVRKGYHCAWQIHYHIVFPVKYRKALLDNAVVEIIRETARGIEERYEIEIEAMGMDKDHIHVLCGGHPKLSPGQIVRIFKSITAKEIMNNPAVSAAGLFIEKGEILDDYLHPNQKRYPEQRIMVIGINNYAYLVPYVEDAEEIFLKTIIPSRKATDIYFGGEK